MTDTPTRDDLASQYLDQLPYEPYPVQEDALLAWFSSDQGVLVCAPTGTGKTIIAEAALFEALHNGTTAYYTTPLIALTEQKFREMQENAERWGFSKDDVGLVTGNRRVNPEARVLVVVAEILLNRLLTPEAFDFEHVSAVVMDEFHNFGDPERGIVWELSLAMLPNHVRLLLLSATVGNSMEFINWLEVCHERKIELVESKDRKIPLTFEWVGDDFLGDHLIRMSKGEDDNRMTPALVFCFNRDECWSVAEHLKGLDLMSGIDRSVLNKEVDSFDWPDGVGPKLKQILRRGIGVHHAGLLPKYRRVVEHMFQKKLLAVCICTETLAAGINLPARSVVMTSMVKGPRGKQKLIDPSSAHQIFGRAGRPQFDDKGYVFALAHEDDVRLGRWREKYDAIPDNSKDHGLRKAKKAMLRKKPNRNDNQTYWTEGQFQSLQSAPPGKLYSKGPMPWRLLAYLLKTSSEVSRLRTALRKRLMDEKRIQASEKQLDRMLLTLFDKGFVTLEPTPLPREERENAEEPYRAERAYATEELDKLLIFRSIHPLFAVFLLKHLGIASREERFQAFESVLELPRPLLKYVRVPFPEKMPPGPLATTRLDPELMSRGLISAYEPPAEGEKPWFDDDWEPPPTLADKLEMMFEVEHPDVHDLSTLSVWGAGELVCNYASNFNLFVRSHDLTKQEGILFRHLLRLILLLGEFAQVTPDDISPEDWQEEMRELVQKLTASCRSVDPTSTDEMIQRAQASDALAGETPSPLAALVEAKPTPTEPEEESVFGEGILDDEA